MARPIDFSPPFGAIDAVGAPTDPPDERIDVGVLIALTGVGGGQADPRSCTHDQPN